MDAIKPLLDKVLSNQLTAFLFVLGCSIGAVIGIAGGYWVTYQAVIYLGAY
jgi:hypothetical protein